MTPRDLWSSRSGNSGVRCELGNPRCVCSDPLSGRWLEKRRSGDVCLHMWDVGLLCVQAVGSHPPVSLPTRDRGRDGREVSASRRAFRRSPDVLHTRPSYQANVRRPLGPKQLASPGPAQETAPNPENDVTHTGPVSAVEDDRVYRSLQSASGSVPWYLCFLTYPLPTIRVLTHWKTADRWPSGPYPQRKPCDTFDVRGVFDHRTARLTAFVNRNVPQRRRSKPEVLLYFHFLAHDAHRPGSVVCFQHRGVRDIFPFSCRLCPRLCPTG